MSEKIEALTVATLGALQGLTEFLPVSSSGHVAIGAHLFDIRENSLVLVILLHLGTLMATIVLFRQDIGNLAVEGVTAVRQPNRLRATPEGRTLVAIAIATVITASIGLAMHDAAEAFAEDLRLVGYGSSSPFQPSSAQPCTRRSAPGGSGRSGQWHGLAV